MYDHYGAQVRRQLRDLRAQLAKTQADLRDEHATSAERARIAADLRQQLKGTQAELAALHQGEEPYDDDRLIPTPAQWIWVWNRATPKQRLAKAEQINELHARIERCMFGFHEQRLAEYSEALQELRARGLRDEQRMSELSEELISVQRIAGQQEARLNGLLDVEDDLHRAEQRIAELEAELAEPVVPCLEAPPANPFGSGVGPCVVTGPHIEHRDRDGARWWKTGTVAGDSAAPACTVCAQSGATAFPHLGIALCQACVDCGCDQDPCERAAVGKRTA